jgi:transcriptional regulator with XRE-family HTH domain
MSNRQQSGAIQGQAVPESKTFLFNPAEIDMTKTNPVDIRVGSRLKNTRKFRGVTLNTLAAALKLSSRKLSRIERGEERFSAELMYSASRILNVRADFFYGDPNRDAKADVEWRPESVVTFLDRYRTRANRTSAADRPTTGCVVLPFGEPTRDCLVQASRRA